MLFRAFFWCLPLFVLVSCGTEDKTILLEMPQTSISPAIPAVIPEPVKVDLPVSSTIAVFLPLTGTYQGLGEELLKTIQLAYMNLSKPSYHLAIYDTKGTAEGALAAYKSMKIPPLLILGPVFSAEVKALLAAHSNMPTVLTFSNDETLQHSQVFLLGLSPKDQIHAVLDYAKNQGYRSEEIVAIFPNNDYGKILEDTLRETEPRLSIFLYNKDDQYFRHVCEKVQKIPARAVLIPEGHPVLSQLIQGLAFADFNFDAVRLLGSALWDKGGDITTLNSKQDPQLLNAWFAAPDPNDRYLFEQQYKKFYGHLPSRFSILGAASIEITHDLIAALHQNLAEKPQDLLRRISFNTVEGTYHFKDNNTSKRPLAILEVGSKGPFVVQAGVKNLVSQVKHDSTQPVSQMTS